MTTIYILLLLVCIFWLALGICSFTDFIRRYWTQRSSELTSSVPNEHDNEIAQDTLIHEMPPGILLRLLVYLVHGVFLFIIWPAALVGWISTCILKAGPTSR